MKKEKNKIDKVVLVIALIFIIVGGCIFLYPNVSNYFAEKNQTEAIREYSEAVSNFNQEKIDEELQKAQTYNENLSGEPVHDPFVEGSGYAMPKNYKEVLNIAEDKDTINSANDLIKDALENYESEKIIDNSKLEEEKSFYNSKDDKYNLDSNLKNTDIVDEIISDDYEENSEITEDETDNKLEEKNIKQHYDIVLDPNEKEYIIYYKKK